MSKIILVLFITFFSCLIAAEITPSGKIYTYKETNGIKRELEVYFPKDHATSKQSVPAIIFFHGGAWVKGSRKSFSNQCDYFAKRGIVAVTANYRLVTKKDKASMKGNESYKRLCIPDVKSAIRWVKEHADELKIDPNRLILGGGSAGAHVGLIATHNSGLNDPNDSKETDTSVVAYILFNPALKAGDSQDKEIDVIQHLNKNTAPAIAFFGDKDTWLKGWKPAFKKWQSLDATTIEVRIAKGQKHAFFNKQPWRDLTILAADEFLQKLGLLEGNSTLSSPIDGQKLEPATTN